MMGILEQKRNIGRWKIDQKERRRRRDEERKMRDKKRTEVEKSIV
jgi:hypothetical protein